MIPKTFINILFKGLLNLDVLQHFNQEKEIQRKLKHIAVTTEVYEQLRNQGKVGDSFNDVVKRLLGKESTTVVTGCLKETGEE
jgi:predicted CopG family antitoxin